VVLLLFLLRTDQFIYVLIHRISIYLPKWILGLEFKDQVLPHLQHQNFESPVLQKYKWWLIWLLSDGKRICIAWGILSLIVVFLCIENLHLYEQMIYGHINVKNNKFWLKMLVSNLLWQQEKINKQVKMTQRFYIRYIKPLHCIGKKFVHALRIFLHIPAHEIGLGCVLSFFF
jgi:hypothetical protein